MMALVSPYDLKNAINPTPSGDARPSSLIVPMSAASKDPIVEALMTCFAERSEKQQRASLRQELFHRPLDRIGVTCQTVMLLLRKPLRRPARRA